jgi:hypothetical protein
MPGRARWLLEFRAGPRVGSGCPGRRYALGGGEGGIERTSSVFSTGGRSAAPVGPGPGCAGSADSIATGPGSNGSSTCRRPQATRQCDDDDAPCAARTHIVQVVAGSGRQHEHACDPAEPALAAGRIAAPHWRPISSTAAATRCRRMIVIAVLPEPTVMQAQTVPALRRRPDRPYHPVEPRFATGRDRVEFARHVRATQAARLFSKLVRTGWLWRAVRYRADTGTGGPSVSRCVEMSVRMYGPTRSAPAKPALRAACSATSGVISSVSA